MGRIDHILPAGLPGAGACNASGQITAMRDGSSAWCKPIALITVVEDRAFATLHHPAGLQRRLQCHRQRGCACLMQQRPPQRVLHLRTSRRMRWLLSAASWMLCTSMSMPVVQYHHQSLRW